MSIQHAIHFMSRVQTDETLRKATYRCASQAELFELLKSYDLGFTEDEFQDAVNHLLLRCTTESQAYSVHEIESWFKLVGRFRP